MVMAPAARRDASRTGDAARSASTAATQPSGRSSGPSNEPPRAPDRAGRSAREGTTIERIRVALDIAAISIDHRRRQHGRNLTRRSRGARAASSSDGCRFVRSTPPRRRRLPSRQVIARPRLPVGDGRRTPAHRSARPIRSIPIPSRSPRRRTTREAAGLQLGGAQLGRRRRGGAVREVDRDPYGSTDPRRSVQAMVPSAPRPPRSPRSTHLVVRPSMVPSSAIRTTPSGPWSSWPISAAKRDHLRGRRRTRRPDAGVEAVVAIGRVLDVCGGADEANKPSTATDGRVTNAQPRDRHRHPRSSQKPSSARTVSAQATPAGTVATTAMKEYAIAIGATPAA